MEGFAKYPEANGGGLGTELCGETLLSALGLLGGLAANFVGEEFAERPAANAGAWQRTFRGEILLSALGLMGGGLAAKFLRGFC